MRAFRVVARVGRMSGEELAFRLGAAVRAGAGRLAAAGRTPRWRVSDLARRLDPSEPLVRHAAERLAAGDRREAHAILRRHFASRDPRFPTSPSALALVRDRLIGERPGLAAEALAEVDRLRRGRFNLLGYRDLDFATGASSGPAPVDWHVDPVHRRRAPAAWWSRVRFLDPANGDHKIIWELNRHQHVLRLARAAWLTGDPACRRTFEAHLGSWLAQNPPGMGINWASMLELGLRSLSWVWALHLFASLPPNPGNGGAEEPWIPDLLLALEAQLEQVRRNLSRYFSPNTHLTGEALALYVCGLALPELRAARRWADAGRAVLIEQAGVQIMPDGGHCERSTHYLRYTLDFYLMALTFARAGGDVGAEAAFEDACTRLAQATRSLSDGRGRLPQLGDDDGGRLWPMREREPADVRDSLAVAAALLDRPDLAIGPPPEEAFWLLGPGVASPQAAGAAPAAGPPGPGRARCGIVRPGPMGYFVARPGPDEHLVVDAGPHGYLNGGHAHADALSLVYTVAGRPLAIDPGTFTYTMSPVWRDRLRSSQWHNTLTLDRRSQSLPAGPFHWQTTAAARAQASDEGPGHCFFEGVHDGYAPLVHRRRVVSLPPGCLIVVDTVVGGGEHLAEVHWHIDAAWTARRDAAGPVLFEGEDGGRARLAVCGAGIELFEGDPAAGLGWQSPVYGRLVPCTTVRLAAGGRLPLTVVSVFSDGAGTGPEVEHVRPANAQGDPADDSLAVCLRTLGREEALLFTGHPVLLPGDPEPDGSGRPHQDGARQFEIGGATVWTSARFAWLTADSGRLPAVRAAVGGEVQVTAEGRREQGVPGAA